MIPKSLIFLSFVTFVTSSLALALDQCLNDTSCYSPRFQLEHQLICLNNTCSCQPDQIKLGNHYQFCLREITNTLKPCLDDSDCSYGSQKCVLNSNSTSACWECSFGSPVSETVDLSGKFPCGEPTYGGWCHLYIDNYPYFPHSYSHGRNCPRDMQCPTGGLGPSSKCICKKGFFFNNSTKVCARPPKLFGKCGPFTQKCVDDLYGYGNTYCSPNGTCLCSNSVYNQTRKVCQTYPQGKCYIDKQCPENSSCWGGTCRCHSSYVDGHNGECLKRLYGVGCDLKADEGILKGLLVQGLKCINSIYRCEFPTEQYYDGGDNWEWTDPHTCVSYAGSRCRMDVYSKDRCTNGSSCVDSVCQCNPGYSRTQEDKCIKTLEGFGGNYCTDNCDRYAGLVCKRGTCQCPEEFMFYDDTEKRCLSLEGRFCGTLTLSGKGNSLEIECQDGLKCSSVRSIANERRKCVRISA